MEFSIEKEVILKPLQLIANVIEKKQTLPILANVLLSANEDGSLSVTGTDMEIELTSRIPIKNLSKTGAVTTSAKKITDICRSLPDQSQLDFKLEKNQLTLSCGQSKFHLATLPAENFPTFEKEELSTQIEIEQNNLRRLLEKTSFAMAQQDVRYYLNGMLLEVHGNNIKSITTDGHRLAISEINSVHPIELPLPLAIILPRKAVLELLRLLDKNEKIALSIGKNLIQTITNDVVFTSKLIDGRYPDYHLVIPKNGNKIATLDRKALKQALARTAILTHERYHSVRIELDKNGLKLSTNNAENEQSEETLPAVYSGEYFEIGLNINYLQDAINALDGEEIKLTFLTRDDSALVENNLLGDKSLYVIMPMRL